LYDPNSQVQGGEGGADQWSKADKYSLKVGKKRKEQKNPRKQQTERDDWRRRTG
jgi:hypothetical protein